MTGPVTVMPVAGIPEAKPGDDVAALVLAGLGALRNRVGATAMSSL